MSHLSDRHMAVHERRRQMEFERYRQIASGTKSPRTTNMSNNNKKKKRKQKGSRNDVYDLDDIPANNRDESDYEDAEDSPGGRRRSSFFEHFLERSPSMSSSSQINSQSFTQKRQQRWSKVQQRRPSRPFDPQMYQQAVLARIRQRKRQLHKAELQALREKEERQKRNQQVAQIAPLQAEERCQQRLEQAVEEEVREIEQLINEQDKSLDAMMISRLISPRNHPRPATFKSILTQDQERRVERILETPFETIMQLT